MITQIDIAQQMVAQQRLLDPGISAEIGTPERKIIDTVAQALADSQVDLTALQSSLDINAKFGSNLDSFLAIFGFGRQLATRAAGFVTFSRIVASTVDIRIPGNTQVVAHNQILPTGNVIDVIFYTTSDVFLAAGTLSVSAPVLATVQGSASNVDTGAVTDFLGSPSPGITSVTNGAPINGGLDPETDDALKVRFKNTVFRNLAGTEDQYLALAVSTAFTTKANVIGPVSRYQEYLQVPPVDDATSYDINGDGAVEGGNGIAGEYTTALSTIPYSKYVYSTNLTFLSGSQGSNFYRQDTDYRVNLTTTTKDKGDTYRLHNLTAVGGVTPAPLGLNPTSALATNQPNITLLNVYTGIDPLVTGVRPNDLVLFEHQYISSVSRNDVTRNVTNAIDIFIDGQNPTVASTVIPRPNTSLIFVNNPNSLTHFLNYRRAGLPNHPPIIGNVLTALFQQPITDLPDQISVTISSITHTFLKGVHYWPVVDVSTIGNSVRSRSGIEWSADVPSQLDGDPAIGPYTGTIITALPSNTSIPITGYTYDRNIADLQAIVESNKQITTDALVHQAKIRYFKLDVTVMYNSGTSIADTNLFVGDAVNRGLVGLPFGGAFQLSDLLQTVHNTSGIDNVRWTTDVPGATTNTKLYETDINGMPLTNLVIDRVRTGKVAVAEIQQIAITGQPTGGTFTLTYNGNTTTPIAWNAANGVVQGALNATPVLAGVTITGMGTPIDPFRLTFSTLGVKPLITADPAKLTGGVSLIAGDFFLADNELVALPTSIYNPPTGLGDTVPGLIIRPRAANTWIKTN